MGTKGFLRRAAAAFWLLCCLAGALVGCGDSGQQEEKVRDLEFTVLGEAEIPAEFKEIIVQKGTAPFKLTYGDNENLYIAIGYGKQPTGGYSISVHELYLTANSIVVDTELKGPEKGEKPGTEQTFPYVVIKTEYLENPVVFQ